MKKEKIFLSLTIILIVATILFITLFSDKDREVRKENKSLITETQDLVASNLENASKKIRNSAVAGQFYPGEAEELRTQIRGYLESAEKIYKEGKIRVLIAPHAGLDFSGKTAGMAFKQIQGEKYSKVIVLGINHKEPFKHAAVFPSGNWATPLGNVPIDQELAARIVNGTDIIFDTQAHKNEHSIEMVVLFLKEALADFELVPIMLGAPKADTTERLAYKLAGVMDEDTLIVVSTDLSHYPTWEVANEVDRKTINGVLSGEVKKLDHASAFNYAKKYPDLSTSACGFQPLRVSMRVAEILNLGKFTEIDYTNSGDITGNKERVVGYAALGVWSTSLQKPVLDKEAREETIKLARDTLDEYYRTNLKMYYEPKSEVLKKPIGAFVSMYKSDSLRGSIGRFDPDIPLYEVIQDMAIAAATQDRRFTPVKEEELSDIDMVISVMGPLEIIDDWRKIKLGVHGVRIVQNRKTGVLLPQVATDNNWDLETFLNTTCTQKAGLGRECYKDPKVKIYTFEADIIREQETL